jgi:predicted TPR repeat methyltransferase
MNSQDARLLANLANALYSLNEIDEAVEIYRQWLQLDPDNPVARHHLAACTRESIPARAEDAYVESLFDDFAETFDEKLEKLGYRGPRLIADAIRRECGAGGKQFSILDAGCGTGLCGPLVIEYAAQLIGVDLSAGMLEKAKLQGVYDSLIKAELTAYLQSQSNVFDVILSADTLLYFGALEDVLNAARIAMRDGGHLFFTVEVLGSKDASDNSELDYYLNPHGRYSHSEAYLRRTLSKAGFMVTRIETAVLRHEYGQAVKSFVVSCRTS